MIKEYDVYYATGGGPIVQGGSDVWVNNWIDNIAPKLNVKPDDAFVVGCVARNQHRKNQSSKTEVSVFYLLALSNFR